MGLSLITVLLAFAIVAHGEDGYSGQSSMPDLAHKPKIERANGNLKYSHEAKMATSVGKTAFAYSAEFNDNVIVLNDDSARVHSVECSAGTIKVTVKYPQLVVANEAAWVSGGLVVGSGAFGCNGEQFIRRVRDVVVMGSNVLIQTYGSEDEDILFIQAFKRLNVDLDHVPAALEPTPKTRSDVDADADVHELEAKEHPRQRRDTQSGCTCTDACHLSLGSLYKYSWCKTDDCGHKESLCLWNCGHWDYCTIEKGMSMDLLNWNYAAGGTSKTASVSLYNKQVGPANLAVTCENCYAYVKVGVAFKFTMEPNWDVELLRLSLTGSAGAAINVKAVLSAAIEGSTPDITLLPSVPGPVIMIPIGPVVLPLSTYFAVMAKISYGVQAQATVTAGASYERSVTYGFEYTKAGGLKGIQSLGGSGFSYTPPALSASASAYVQVTVSPQVRFQFADWIPLSATVMLSPYAGLQGQASSSGSCKLSYESYTGLDLAVKTDPIGLKLGSFKAELIGAKSWTINLLQKAILKSGCAVGSRRRGQGSGSLLTDTLQAVPQESYASRVCDVACPAHSNCSLIGDEPSCACHAGYEAVDPGDGVGTCVATDNTVKCSGVSCPEFAECRLGKCFCKLGYNGKWDTSGDGKDNGKGHAKCVRDPSYGEDKCVTQKIECPSRQICSEGQCVCQKGFYLDKQDGNRCIATQMCKDQVCGANAECRGGRCYCTAGYRFDAGKFNCVAHNPLCQSLTRVVLSSDVSCWEGATCKDKHCVCDSGKLSFNLDGSYRCAQEGDRCDGQTCEPGSVCNPANGQCAPMADPCQLDNGGCADNAYCRNYPEKRGWLCSCNRGYSGDGYRKCNLVSPCLVGIKGGCSLKATCSADKDNKRVCTCVDGYEGDGYTCTSTVCKENNGGCHENAACLPGPTNGEARCKCHLGYRGDGKTGCDLYDACLVNNGGCSRNTSMCMHDASDRTKTSCQCLGGFIEGEGEGEGNDDGSACVPATPCSMAQAQDLKCSQECVIKGDTPSCRCLPGHRDVSGDGKSCVAISACKETAAGEACPGEHKVCIDTLPGRFKCGCDFGYEINATTGDCQSYNPCDMRHRSGCDMNAVCEHTGPGLAICTCVQGFEGNGKSCQQINPCKSDTCGSNEECVFTGPNQHRCDCSAHFQRAEGASSGACVAVDYCATLNGGCPRRSTCSTAGLGHIACTCEKTFAPILNGFTGSKGLEACVIAFVDIVSAKKGAVPLKGEQLTALAQLALQGHVDAPEKATATVVSSGKISTGMTRTTFYVEVSDVAVAPRLVMQAVREAKAERSADVAKALNGEEVGDVYEDSDSPVSPNNLEEVAAKGGDGMSAGAIAGIAIGVAAVFIILIAFVVMKTQKRGAARPQVGDHESKLMDNLLADEEI